MKIPMLDAARLNRDLEEDLLGACARVISSGNYILGEEVEAFEHACADRLGASFAIGVSSGTDALIASLMALEIGPGDEVVLPALTFFATAGAVVRLGATPVFADIDLETYAMSLDAVRASVSPATQAIIAVHLFGACTDPRPLTSFASEASVPVIEDAAQAFGATSGGKCAGTFGALGAFSFYPTKNLGGFGDAGLVVTNSQPVAERVRLLRTHGASPKHHHAIVGGNFRLDALHAALLRAKLPLVEEWQSERLENAAFYRAALLDAGIAEINTGQTDARAPVLLPSMPEGHSANQFQIRVTGDHRDGLRAYLTQRGVQTEIYYPVALHRQVCFESLEYPEDACPNAVLISQQALALPIFAGLTEEELAYVVASVRAYFARSSG